MSRYIDADVLLENVQAADMVHGFVVSAFAIVNAPTADVVPVVHGHWADTGSGQECSVCGEIQYGYDSGRYYCQNCGAKMDVPDTNVGSKEVSE